MMLRPEQAIALERKRGISPGIAELFGVVSHPTIEQSMGFQFRDGGRVSHTKWRFPDKQFRIEPAGQPKIFWNIDSLRVGSSPPPLVIITEGEIDALSFLQAEVSCVISVPNGAAGNLGTGDIDPEDDNGFSYLWRGNAIIPELAHAETIILATDSDKPGRILAQELAIRLGKERCYLVEYPEGCKDCNDVLMRHGPEAVQDLIGRVRPMWPTELVPVPDLPDDPFSEPHSVGWSAFGQENMLITPPELIITTGCPNAGKSEWSWNLACQMARLHRWKTSIIQFEDKKERLMRSLGGYAETWSRDPDWKDDIGNPTEWVRRHFFAPMPESIDDVDSSRCLNWVLERIKEAATRHGCRMVIIDPWNEIEHDWGRQYSETQYIMRSIKLLKQAMRRYSIVINLIAHPTKEGEKIRSADANLNVVSGGAAWNAKADHGVHIDREDEDPSVSIVKICKSRDWEIMGRPGTARLQFDPHGKIYRYAGRP